MNNEMRNGWIDIISKMYKDLHNSERVMHISKEYDKKRERLLNYFNRLEKILVFDSCCIKIACNPL